MDKKKIPLLFMGWLILYSLMYFISLDIIGIPPGKEDTALLKIVNYGVLFAVSIPLWWFSWRRFLKVFGANDPVTTGAGATEYRFALRNPELMYYLMILKLFLLAMGANGIIVLSHYEGVLRTFYIWNFIILYLYAIPFFVIKLLKLKKGLAARITMTDDKLCLRAGTVSEIPFASIEKLFIDEAAPAMFVQGNSTGIYLAGKTAKLSPFYLPGAETIMHALRQKAGNKIEQPASLKQAVKQSGAGIV